MKTIRHQCHWIGHIANDDFNEKKEARQHHHAEQTTLFPWKFPHLCWRLLLIYFIRFVLLASFVVLFSPGVFRWLLLLLVCLCCTMFSSISIKYCCHSFRIQSRPWQNGANMIKRGTIIINNVDATDRLT